MSLTRAGRVPFGPALKIFAMLVALTLASCGQAEKTGSHLTGRAFLVGDEKEESGFGLYTYLLFPRQPSPAERERALRILGSYAKLPEIAEVRRSFRKDQLNITYVPVVRRRWLVNDGPESILKRYNFELAASLLTRLGIKQMRGPYVISTLKPLLESTKVPFLLQDLSGVEADNAAAWSTIFSSELTRRHFWDPAIGNQVAQAIRQSMAVKWGEFPEFVNNLNYWIVWDPNSDNSVLVRLAIDSHYDDSERSLKELSALLDFLPASTADLVLAESVEKLIRARYGIEKNSLPKTYSLVLASILNLNGWSGPEQLNQRRAFKVPKIPPLSPSTIVRTSGHFAVGLMPVYSERVAAPASAASAASAASVASVEPAAPAASVEPAAPAKPGEVANAVNLLRSPAPSSSLTLVDYRIPENYLANGSIQAYLFEKKADFLSKSLGIRWAGFGEQVNGVYQLAAPLQKIIRDRLSSPLTREVNLFIVDSGWPSPTAYEESRKTLFSFFDAIRDRFLLDPVSRSDNHEFTKPLNPHCQEIEISLRALTDLDTKGRIKIIYVPITHEQHGDDVLREMLELHYISKNRGYWPVGKKRLSGAQLQEASDYATEILGKLKDDAHAQEIKTDSAVLEALFDIANEISTPRKNGDKEGLFFVNESWTVYTDTLNFELGVYPLGLAIVAAGNDPRRVVDSVDDWVDFGRRCHPPQLEALTVINLDGNGKTQCSTSTVRQDSLSSILAVGYDGNLPTSCGTSFAAPRVAWLLSYIESTRSCNADRVTWVGGLQQRLVMGRSNTNGLGALLFDPEKTIWASSTAGNCGDPNPSPYIPLKP